MRKTAPTAQPAAKKGLPPELKQKLQSELAKARADYSLYKLEEDEPKMADALQRIRATEAMLKDAVDSKDEEKKAAGMEEMPLLEEIEAKEAARLRFNGQTKGEPVQQAKTRSLSRPQMSAAMSASFNMTVQRFEKIRKAGSSVSARGRAITSKFGLAINAFARRSPSQQQAVRANRRPAAVRAQPSRAAEPAPGSRAA